MCGIVGVISKKGLGLTYKETKIFKELLFANTLRGLDATGVFGINKHGNLKMAKAAIAAPFALSNLDMSATISYGERALIGHNRAATIGNAKDDNNAHPFIEDHICLVHNGTLHTHTELANKTVDSHAICHSIASRGYKETLPMINGAFALVWYDAKKKEIFVAKNDERPLSFVETDSAIFMASELDMLRWIVDRNNIGKYEDGHVLSETVYRFNTESYALTEEKFKKKEKQAYLPYTTGSRTGYTKTNTPESIWVAEYATGDTIKFKVDTIEFDSHLNAPIANGYTDEDYLITAYLTDDLYKSLLDNPREATLSAKITMIHYFSSKKSMTIKCGYATEIVVDAPKIVVSTNGVKVSEAMFEEQCGCCTHCGGFIDHDDIKNSHVKVKKHNITTLVCEDCLNEFRKTIPDYGKGKRYRKKGNHNSVSAGQQISEELAEIYPILCGHSSSYC